MTEQPISLVDSQLSFVFSFFNGLYLKKKKKIIYLFLAVPGLCCCVGFSLIAVKGGYSLVVVHRLPIAVVSLVAENRL